ncbi:FtsH protease activity modulator HflK [Psychromonas sp. 14N.309.X.WAT.B.A12]|uniref:FtsH protease activity modulator HflK n=1 Tax=Psychromonas sp. 14N.309.X.WAT.B.A12 TaxID=2998322 RepID=UPI0025B246ED|nr:FtsH protease activity modulator HflK [Psychromonas sp. 14N.309.X.WAT.B.A12]MDN2664178.1 FtsH protease activity modulator HflK [Psychromonas sp. 14N.309.X.WAT.B.A12]
MAWNEPGKDDKKDQDPWNKNDKKNEQGPPDLDVVFQKISGFLGGLFGKKSTQGPSSGNSGNGGKVVAIAILSVIAIVWFASGWYTIKESDRGVVLRFGAYHSQVEPGLHWNPKFVDQIIPINVEAFRTLPTSGFMLTEDENIVQVSMEIQYRIVEPEKYLFSVTNADNSLLQALDSSLRFVIGHSTMDDALTTGREVVRQETWEMLNKIIESYHLGIQILDVNLQQTRPPEQVRDAFDDAIAAQEDEERFVREAEAYEREKEPIARGQVKRIEQQARSYEEGIILEAQGAVAKFNQLLPEYQANPEVTRQRLYIETMEKVLGNASKVLIDNKAGGNLTFLPLDKLMDKSNNTTRLPVETEIETRSREDQKADLDERAAINERASRSSRTTGRDY